MASHPHYPSHPETEREQREFMLARQDGIYSTDSVAILGLSKYGTPMSVYLDKTEPPEPHGTSLQAWLGWQLEPSLAQLYAERYEVEPPTPFDDTYTHMKHGFIKTHLDFVDETDEGAPILVEGKTRTQRSKDWGEDGSSKVPVDIWVQVQHEMLATDTYLARIPVLFGLHTFNVFEVPRDDVFLDALVPKLDAFWHNHIVARMPPELTGLPFDEQRSKRYEQTDESLRQATPEQEALINRYRMAKMVISQAERDAKTLEVQLRELIGEHAGLTSTIGDVTYKVGKGRRNWELMTGSYKAAAEQLLSIVGELQGVDRELIDRIASQLNLIPELYVSPGTRTLRATFTEASND